MKVLILGASGLLGNACARSGLRRGFHVVGVGNRRPPPSGTEALALDATDEDAVTRACLELWPEVVINAAAVSSPVEVDRNPERAERLNVALPRQLAQLCSHIGARFLHISTDLVYPGRGNRPIPPTALPDPITRYGRMKLQAEREILEHNTQDPVVLRVTLVSGNSPGGERSVHETLLQALSQGQRPRLFEDEIRQPCSAGNVADVLVELAERRDLHGIFHWAGTDALSRYEIAVRMLHHLCLPKTLVERTRKADHASFAGRPSDLRFDLQPLKGKLKTRPATFDEILQEIEVPPSLRKWHEQTREKR